MQIFCSLLAHFTVIHLSFVQMWQVAHCIRYVDYGSNYSLLQHCTQTRSHYTIEIDCTMVVVLYHGYSGYCVSPLRLKTKCTVPFRHCDMWRASLLIHWTALWNQKFTDSRELPGNPDISVRHHNTISARTKLYNGKLLECRFSELLAALFSELYIIRWYRATYFV